MSRLTNARRWAAHGMRKKLRATEGDITPDEARTALLSILLQRGLFLERMSEYDPRKDRFRCVVRDEENKLLDCWVPGEAVAKTVIAARTMSGLPSGLIRPSEAISAVR